MSYMIYGFGYDVMENETGIETREEAEKIFEQKVEEWCKEHDVNIDDTDYIEGDYFSYGQDEKGYYIYEIIEEPIINTEIDELIWQAKLALKDAESAAIDYSYTLMDNCVDQFTGKVEEYLDEIVKIIKKGE